MRAFRVFLVLSMDASKDSTWDLLFILCTTDIGIIVKLLGLKHQTYDGANQIYALCFPAECASFMVKVIDCIDVADKWMASNRLMLIPSKLEFLRRR